jgi:iron complex transport system ATP-binding protein
MIEIKDLSFSYNQREVLSNIDIRIEDGEIVSIIGPNGSGKTTLLRCINKVLRVKKGKILIRGQSLEHFSLRRLSTLLGYVPQRETSSFPFTVFEIVLMGRRPYINWGLTEYDIEVVNETLGMLDLDGFSNRFFDELSGGERQRVLIARAFAQEPRVLLLDEPTTSLDLKHQLEVFDLIKEIGKKKGVSIIYAIHDLYLAAKFSERVIMLKNGRIFVDGVPEDVITTENIRKVYGVEAYTDSNGGSFHIVPVRALKEERQ